MELQAQTDRIQQAPEQRDAYPQLVDMSNPNEVGSLSDKSSAGDTSSFSENGYINFSNPYESGPRGLSGGHGHGRGHGHGGERGEDNGSPSSVGDTQSGDVSPPPPSDTIGAGSDNTATQTGSDVTSGHQNLINANLSNLSNEQLLNLGRQLTSAIQQDLALLAQSYGQPSSGSDSGTSTSTPTTGDSSAGSTPPSTTGSDSGTGTTITTGSDSGTGTPPNTTGDSSTGTPPSTTGTGSDSGSGSGNTGTTTGNGSDSGSGTTSGVTGTAADGTGGSTAADGSYTDGIIEALRSSDPALSKILSDAHGVMSTGGFSSYESTVYSNVESDGSDGILPTEAAVAVFSTSGLSDSDNTAVRKVMENDFNLIGDTTTSTYQPDQEIQDLRDTDPTLAQSITNVQEYAAFGQMTQAGSALYETATIAAVEADAYYHTFPTDSTLMAATDLLAGVSGDITYATAASQNALGSNGDNIVSTFEE